MIKLKLFQKRKENIIINCYISISDFIGKFKSISLKKNHKLTQIIMIVISHP